MAQNGRLLTESDRPLCILRLVVRVPLSGLLNGGDISLR